MRKGWTEVALGEVCRLEKGSSATMKAEAGPYPLVVTASYRRTSASYQFDAPAVCIPLVSSTGHGNAAIHRIHYQDGRFALANILVAAIPDGKSALSPKYLWRYLSAQKDRILVPLMQGTANVTLKEHDLLKVKIEMPSLVEQQRIVAHLDAIESRITLAQKLREDVALEVEAFTTSQHLAAAKTKVVRLERLLRLDEKQEIIKPDGSYPQVGLRSFGLGMFKKPPVLGSETTYRSFNVLRTGQFVMSQVKGWEGAVAVAGKDYNGWFASPEYRTFSCVEGECDSAYLSHIVSTSWFQKQLLSATRGVGARRERVRPEMLLGLELPFPDFDQQVKAVPILEKQRLGLQLSAQARERANALLPSLLDKLFNV